MSFQYEFIETEITEPVTLEEVKAYMRIDADYASDDAIINSFITASRERLELYLNLGLVPHTVRLQWNGYPIQLPFSPTTNDDITVLKVDDDTALEADEYTLKGLNEKTLWVNSLAGNFSFFYGLNGEISLWEGYPCNPTMYDVLYDTGYETVPKAIKNALMADVDYMYKNQGKQEMASISPVAIQLSHNYSKNLIIQ